MAIRYQGIKPQTSGKTSRNWNKTYKIKTAIILQIFTKLVRREMVYKHDDYMHGALLGGL